MNKKGEDLWPAAYILLLRINQQIINTYNMSEGAIENGERRTKVSKVGNAGIRE